MFKDYENELTRTGAIGTAGTSKQSVVGPFGTAIVGGRVLDKKNPVDLGAGEPLVPTVRVVTAVLGATGGIQVDVVGADNAALTTNPVVVSTRTIALAALVANALFALPQLLSGTSKQFWGVKITPLTANSTQGEVIVDLMPGDTSRPQNGVNYL